jgi:multiple sugar transport system substrate-binding protein
VIQSFSQTPKKGDGKMKYHRFLPLILIFALLMAACAPAATEAPATEAPQVATEAPAVATEAPAAATEAPPAEEPITMRYFMWDPSFEEKEQEMVDKFTAAYPNVTIDFEVVGTPDYWTKLSALSAAGDLPCVFNMSSGYVDQWISDGLLLDIQEYVDRDIEADDYYSGVFDVTRDKSTGNMHAFPFAFVETVLYYNKDAFDAAGVEYPSEGWTWADFLEAAKALTVDDDGDGTPEQYGFWFYGRYAHIESWVYQNGGRLLNETKTRFEADDKAVEALAFLDSLIHEHGVAPEPKEMEGIRQQDVFPLGMTAMWVDGAWNINGNRESIGDEFQWGIAPVPRGPQAVGDTAYGWPDSMSIAATCEHPEMAWEFINFMTGPERTIDLTFGGKVPIYEPVALSEEFLEKDLQPDNKEFILTWAENTGPTSFTPGWGEWRGYADGAGLEGQLNDVFNGVSDLETAIQNTTDHANGVLERYYP